MASPKTFTPTLSVSRCALAGILLALAAVGHAQPLPAHAAPATAPATAQSSAPTDPRPAPGFRDLQVPATPAQPALSGGLWFPTRAEGPRDRVFDTAIFHGTEVVRSDSVQAGRFPLIVLSHGMGGHWRSLAWLANGLAREGAVVAAVNHPGSSFGDTDLRRSLDHGSRVEDLRRVLNAVLADPVLAPHLDADRIHAVGFSFGGWTALSIGGLRGDLGAYADYCARSAHRHCTDIARAGIDLRQLDAARWERSYKDPRIQRVVAIDPGLHQGLTAAHASELTRQTLLIGLGEGEYRLPDTDFSDPVHGLARQLPWARTRLIAPAFHFSALPLCKPAGPALLAEERDDPVCTDPPGADRRDIHRALIAATARHLGLNGR